MNDFSTYPKCYVFYISSFMEGLMELNSFMKDLVQNKICIFSCQETAAKED